MSDNMVGKISVIVPTFNTEEYLDECLNSLTKQTYNDIEIILINDNSNPTTSQKLSDWEKKDTRIRIIQNEERLGVGASRNIGVSQSTGEYVYFLDSDDYLQEDTLELLVKNIGINDIISGGVIETHISKEKQDNEGKDSGGVNINSQESFRSMSVLSHLFRKSFLLKHKLAFSEVVSVYAEVPFVLPIINTVNVISYVENSIYYRRLRNDPISNPSLLQGRTEFIIKDFLVVYNNQINKNRRTVAGTYLQKKFVGFYKKTIIPYFLDSNNIESVFKSLEEAVNNTSDSELNSRGYFLKREFKSIRKGDIEKYYSTINIHRRLRVIKTALSGRTKFLLQIYNSVFNKLPLKSRTVVFESFLGKSYSDSPKYIYEYMVNTNMNYNYIWIFNEIGKNIPGNAKQVKRFSFKYYYYLATSKYWVSNSRMPKRLIKRKGNIYLQTWHGTPLKNLVFDMKDVHSANPNYKKDFYLQSRRWDYLISANQYSSDIFRRAFKYEKDMLEIGYPRNDILYDKDKEAKAIGIKKSLNIPLDKKVILYAPTWRDDEFFDTGKYKFNLQLDLEQMKKELKDEYVIVLRMHYFISNQLDISSFKGFAYDYSKYDDIAELYLISDLLITDYSSVFFDYANLKRPILFYTYDLEKYRNTLRGFYINIEEEVPGPLLKTTEEVVNAIVNLGGIKQEYKEKYEHFYQTYCNWDNGDASRITVEKVFLDN